MITYTTLMGLCAGTAMILATWLGYRLFYKKQTEVTYDGWALAFGGLGFILTALSLHMSLTWPLQNPERFKNFMFGEPNLALGVLLLIGAFFLWRRSSMLGGKKYKDNAAYIRAVAQPIVWIIFALGLVLAACTVAAFQYQVFGTAPPEEPIIGTWPKELVNFSLSMLYAIPALGCLLTPVAFYTRGKLSMATVGASWLIGGAGWLLVAVLVYYTHIAMDFNFRI